MTTEQIIYVFVLIVAWFISVRIAFREGYNACLDDIIRILEDHDINVRK